MKIDLNYKLLRRIMQDLSIYFDENIPTWLKTKRALKKEVKRQFIEAMKKEMQKQMGEDEERILWGDPNCKEQPVGILSAGIDCPGGKCLDSSEIYKAILLKKET